MSSARLPLALAVLGLAACAHTPSSPASYLLPDIRHGAPAIVKSSGDVPAGYDDHIVISVDHQALMYGQQQAALAPHGHRYYYYYGHSAAGPSRPSGASSSGQTQVSRPPPTVSARPAMPSAPRRSGNYDRHRSHD